MPQYLTPGVYVEETSFRAPSIEGVGTSTAAFAGPTRTGPVGLTPTLLTSFGDFQAIYGGYDNLALNTNAADPKNVNYMAMGVKAFFDNGGSQLYVSRVFAAGSTGTASGGDSNVAVAARFPGAFGNGNVTVTLRAARTQTVGALPAGSLLATVPVGAASIASVGKAVIAADTQITLAAPFTGTLPTAVLIDSEIIGVTSIDTTKLIVTVTRGAGAAGHAIGAPLFAPSGSLGADMTDTTGTTATLAAPISGTLPAGALPATVQIDGETLAVTGADATGTKLTVTRGAGGSTAATHKSGAPVFAPATVTLYSNGAGGAFMNGANALPTPLPAGVYVLTMSVTAPGASGSPQVYDGLGFHPAHPSYLGAALAANPPRPIDALQNQVSFTLANTLTPATLYAAIFGASGSPLTSAVKTYTLTNGSDGAEPTSTDYDTALALLNALEDVAIVGAPGSGVFAASQNIVNSLITHVSRQRAYRVAILETPPNQLAADNENVRSQIDSSYAALYVPWVVTPNPLARSGTSIAAEVAVPPTGFIAGIYARNDEQNGVAKAPANEVVLGASRFERNISFAEQGILNPLGINCLRSFPGRGLRVWGARTASSDTEFMYVNVRRYLIYLEHSIDNSTQWAVFENNGPALWARVTEAIESFLYNEWKEGSLLGDSAAQAYFVRCDRTTMTQNDLDNGRLICLVGVALLKPAEFVIFRIGQWTSDAQS